MKRAFIILCLLPVALPAATTNVVVVSAARINTQTQCVLTLPADATEISRAQIESAHANSLPDLLSTEGNLFIRSSNGKGNTGEISMRGFGENSGLRVLVLIDEQKMNQADMGGIDWQQIALDDIESIQILRGGQSVLYGNHALSGVVKITTRKGGDPEVQASASAGSFGNKLYSLHASGETDHLFFDAGYVDQRDDGYRTNSESWSRNFNASLGANLTETDTLTLRLAAGENYYQLPGPLSYQQFQDNPRQSTNEGNQYSESDNGLVTALWEGERNWGTIQINSGINWRDIDWEMSGSAGRNDQEGYSCSPKILYGDAVASISGGLDCFVDTLHFDGDRSVTINQARFDRLTLGPFLHAQKMMTDRLTVSGGARFEQSRTNGKNRQYNKSDMQPYLNNPFGGLSPNPNYPAKPDPAASFDGIIEKQGWASELSLNWQPAESFSLWCGYDRVYRYPALDETSAYQGFPLADPMNTRLDPETGNNIETGAKFVSNGWSASATLFCLWLDDEIAYDDAEKLNMNIGKTRHSGSDVEFGYATEWSGISCRAEWARAVFTDGPNKGKTVPLVPLIHTSASLWFHPIEPVKITVTSRWVGRQFQGGDVDNNDQKIKGYALFDLRAEIECRKNIHLFIKAENLLNKSFISSAYNGGFYPGAGRAIYGGITVKF